MPFMRFDLLIIFYLTLSLLSSALLAAPSSEATPATTASGISLAPTKFKVGAFSFTRPATWKWENPTSSMRKAQLIVLGKNGTTALVTFFYFGPGQGGTVQANVDRWAAQFTSKDGTPVTAVTTSQKAMETTITFVSASGTFANGMPGGPTESCPNYALRGAILESPQGDVYVKMTGPETLVKEETATFDKMVTLLY